MTIAPAVELQSAIRGALIADPDVFAVVDQRIVSNPPDTIVFPYIRIGALQELVDDDNCSFVDDLFQNLSIFTRDGGNSQANQIAHDVKRVLHDATFGLTVNALRMIQVTEKTLGQVDDSRTTHVVLKIKASVEEAP